MRLARLGARLARLGARLARLGVQPPHLARRPPYRLENNAVYFALRMLMKLLRVLVIALLFSHAAVFSCTRTHFLSDW